MARLGGDEFLVILEELSSNEEEATAQAELVVEKIRDQLRQSHMLGKAKYSSTASIGIALFSGDQESEEELLKHADIAMYQAKTAGRDTHRFYEPAMTVAINERALMEEELRQAYIGNQFCLYFQIQLDHQNNAIGAETLLRWMHPERGIVPPYSFIELAEETGLIVPMGIWVLESACAQLKIWQQSELTSGLTLAVNVSARQFRQPDFVYQIKRILQESGAGPSRLKLELTESTVLENVGETIEKMNELRQIGVTFSMDDFGTGYSSLQYLKRLPLDQIKIDQSFVRDITTDPNDAVIVQTIIAMGMAMKLNVIAEGVETEGQRSFLLQHGCEAFQGYLFSKPIPLDEFETLLNSRA